MKITLEYKHVSLAERAMDNFDEEWPPRKLSGYTITFKLDDARLAADIVEYAVSELSLNPDDREVTCCSIYP